MGEHALISGPSLWALLPLVVYTVLVFRGVKTLNATLIGVFVGFILTGQTPASFAGMMRGSLSSFLALIGLIIMLAAGLGAVLNETKVSHTIVHWIVGTIGVDNEKKGILALIFSSTVICGLLGTLAGGNALIAPILIPIVASVGITRSTVGAIFQSAGETGLIWGPFTPPVIALLGVTGLSYWEMMKWAALPFGIIWLVVIYFCALRIQKSTKEWDQYEDIEDAIVHKPTKQEKITTAVFVVSFVALIAYGMITKQKTNFVPVVLLTLTLVTGLAGKLKFEKTMSTLTTGMGNMVSMFLLFIMFDLFIDLIALGDGFGALAEILLGFIENTGRVGLMLVGSFVGAFGVEGAAVAQISITHEMFAPTIETMKLPMVMWAIALIAASRITSSVYPTANMMGQMGIARSNNLRAMLFAGWSVSLTALVYIIVWAFLGEAIFF